jgi:hypothetical protein
MNNVGRIAFQLTLFLVFGLMSCTSSKKMARAKAVTELQQMQSAVQDMNIVVSAGVTKDEYSKRLTDALLKFGDRGGGCKQIVAKFPEEEQQSAASDVCQSLDNAMDAYTDAKEYMGLEHDHDFPDVVSDELTEKEYEAAKAHFPNLEELPIAETNQNGYKFYARSAMVQGLWKVAGQESERARNAVGKLAQM